MTARLSHFFHDLIAQPRGEARAYETVRDELERVLIARESRNLY